MARDPRATNPVHEVGDALSPDGAESSSLNGDPDGTRSNLNLALPALLIDFVALPDEATSLTYEAKEPS